MFSSVRKVAALVRSLQSPTAFCLYGKFQNMNRKAVQIIGYMYFYIYTQLKGVGLEWMSENWYSITEQLQSEITPSTMCKQL